MDTVSVTNHPVLTAWTVFDSLKRLGLDANAALRSLVRKTKDQAAELAEDVSSGRITPRAFGDRMADLLERAHTDAVFLGRTHTGDLGPEEADDRRFAALIVDEEAEFLAGFVADLEAGRYEGKAEQVARRAELYAGRLVGTSNEAFVLASPEEERWEWRLGGAEHCSDCPRLAAAGPYTTAELQEIGYPRSNRTSCLGNCRCFLVRQSDGMEGLNP